MAAGMEQAIRDLEQRLTAQTQRQLLEQQQQQQQEVAALSQIVTQQRQAGTELQTEVTAQQRIPSQEEEGAPPTPNEWRFLRHTGSTAAGSPPARAWAALAGLGRQKEI